MLILQFLIFQIIIFGVVILILRKILYINTQGAINRFEGTYQDLVKKQTELGQKIEEMEKEYQAKKEEANKIVDKMKTEALEESRAKRDEILKQAKAAADEIATKARESTDSYYKKIEQDVTRKMIDQASQLLMSVLTPNMAKLFHDELLKDFLERCKEFDLSSVGSHVDHLTIKVPVEVTPETIETLRSIVANKLNRGVKVEAVVDPSLKAGVLLQFGTLLIDGSIANFIHEAGEEAKRNVQYQ